MRRKRTSRTGLWLVAVMVFVMCGILSYQKSNLEDKGAKTRQKLHELNTNIQIEEDRKVEVEQKKAYVQTYDYIEQMAREKLGLVYEDEIIFKNNNNK